MTTKIERFLFLGNYTVPTLSSRFVCTDEFTGKYTDLKCNNGGGWCRLDGQFGKIYKVCVVKLNKTIRYSWDITPSEKAVVLSELELLNIKFKTGTSIYLIKVCGVQSSDSSRSIRQDIRAVLEKLPCVACGSSSFIEIDHKNGLYNDGRVLNVKTQCIDDFQTLCKHCNGQKRQTYNNMKTTGIRYPATRIPSLRVFGCDYITGNGTYDPLDVNAMVGTYWYDPVRFFEGVKLNSR